MTCAACGHEKCEGTGLIVGRIEENNVYGGAHRLMWVATNPAAL
jgi:hypothetical protein